MSIVVTEVLSEKGRFAPLPADDSTLRNKVQCPVCEQFMVEGDVPSLINGVPADDEEQTKADQGRAHTVVAKIAHERCVYPDEE